MTTADECQMIWVGQWNKSKMHGDIINHKGTTVRYNHGEFTGFQRNDQYNGMMNKRE